MAATNPLIAGASPTFRRYVRRCAWALAMLACWCMPPWAGAQARGAQTPPPVREISLDRDCGGCDKGLLVVLHRDGRALLTRSGKARLGTAAETAIGTVRSRDFDRIARLAIAQGFFEMQDEYQDPELADGAWTTLRIVRGTQDKRVFRREDAGPASLKALEAAIDELRARIRFVPDGR